MKNPAQRARHPVKETCDMSENSTKERILFAAGEMFAEKGFAETTVRDICAQADSNLASVNYHFRDKESLFNEVITFFFKLTHEKHPMDKDFDTAGSAQEKLKLFIRNLIMPRHDPELPSWFHKLMSRNFQFAHPYVKPLIRKHKEAARKILGEIIRNILGDDADEYKIRIAENGVMGQIMFIMRPRHCDKEPSLPEIKTDSDFNTFVDHIYTFALGGIEKLKGE